MEEVIEKIRELMQQIDPTLDVSAGSAFDQVVLQYIRDNFGVGDLNLDLEDMMIRRIGQLDPEINTAPGSAVNEFLIKVLPAIFQVPQLEVQRVKDNQDLTNIPNMTDGEVDRRLGNLFVTRREGDVSIGLVRAFFSNPVPIRTNLSNRAVTASGLAFFPDGSFEASRNLVAGNRQDGLFYVDIPFVSESTGDQYNIIADSITSIENLPGLVRATNPNGFVGGVPRETNDGLFARGQKSLSERSLSSKNSIVTILSENLPNQALAIAPIGFGDPEMTRDVFTVRPSVALDGVALQVEAPTGAGGIGPYSLGHSDVDPQSLVIYADLVLLAPANYIFTQGATPEDVDVVTLDGVTATSSVTIRYIPFSAYAPLIDDLPGSIEAPPLFPGPAVAQEVHVGGKFDTYIKPASEEQAAITISSLDRYTLFKASDGNVNLDLGDNLWYFSTVRGLSLAEIGARRGDILELLTVDAYGNATVRAGDTLVISKEDVANNRYLLEAGPADLVDRNNVDLQIRLANSRCLPLERLVAVDNLGDLLFLDVTGLPEGRATEYDQAINIPLAASLGHINRDSSDPRFPRTFQTRLPQILSRESSLFDPRDSGVDGEDTGDGVPIGGQRFADGVASEGKILYAPASENIASGNLLTPWVHFKEVTFFDALTQQALPTQPIRHIYPADIRSNDLSGGIDSDATNTGFEPSGKVRVYFEQPTTVLMYGQAYGDNSTKFIRRVSREVAGGALVDFNLVYRLVTHGPAGGPAVLVLPENFVEDNGLWYFEVFVQGSHLESERSDTNPVLESDLNLGDDQEMWVGDFALSDDAYHRIDELEFEQAGSPVAKGLTSDAADLPVDAEHPYAGITGTWSGAGFTITGSPELISNQILTGFSLRVLAQSSVPYRTGVVSNIDVDVTIPEPEQVTNSSGADFVAEGVQIGDTIEIYDGVDTAVREVTGFVQVSSLNDTLTYSGALTGAGEPAPGDDPLTLEVFKWVAISEEEIVDIDSATELTLASTGAGSGLRFVIVDQNGTFRLKNPHIRTGFDSQVLGSPGNEPNKGFRAEGYWFDSRNPFDRTVVDDTYTFSKDELTLLKYTEGADTRYLPNKTPIGSEIDLPRATGRIIGDRRDNFTFMTGVRTAVTGSGFELAIGPGLIWETAVDGTTTDVDLQDDSVDSSRIRVFIPTATGEKELTQLPQGSTPAAGEYVFAPSAGAAFGLQNSLTDRVTIHSTDEALALANGGGRVQYFSKIDSVVFLDESAPGFMGAEVTDIQSGALVVFFSSPKTADEMAVFVNDASANFFAMTGEDDTGSPVTAATEILDRTSTGTVTFENTPDDYFEDSAVDFSALNLQAGDLLYIESATNQGFYPITAVSPSNVNRLFLASTLLTEDAAANADYRILRGYSNPVDTLAGLGENFISRQIPGRSIQISYEWSNSVATVHDFVTASDVRSINQDPLVRHGIPVFVNVQMNITSQFVDEASLESAIQEYILLLDQQPLRVSALVRLPALADHIPLPLNQNGMAILENRRLRTYRDEDGIDPRRIEALIPGVINVTESV